MAAVASSGRADITSDPLVPVLRLATHTHCHQRRRRRERNRESPLALSLNICAAFDFGGERKKRKSNYYQLPVSHLRPAATGDGAFD